ncbi:TspO/MBR family protein [Macrococcus brunensis]|uniref:TspO/MBR family protein n=1 Tax=Macrococcus brunensis TaxID=198483 RepID=UPI001EF09141|nr:TspO/MBR family protein [Macrococcus brunensis]ULG72019.1 tryptophan-rich sensory protein [Macrococcus brunensis]ULG74272.1 tryptophan-rich sensory protein [Macrococcus brunensis]
MTVKKQIIKMTLPLAGGLIVGALTSKAQGDYKQYEQPPLAPPPAAFPIVWPVLYTGMGVAYYLADRYTTDKSVKVSHYAQLGLNYLWSILYFNLKLRGTALIESFCLLAAGLLAALIFYDHNEIAGLLMAPYVAWLAYASYLTAGTIKLNHDKPGFSRDF